MSYQAIRLRFVVVALLALGSGVARAQTSAPAMSASAARAEIDRLLSEAEKMPPEMTHADALRIEGDRYEQIARRIEAFLKQYPDDSAADRFTVARFRAMYWTATVRGYELDPLEAEVNKVDVEKARPVVRVAVSYWKARLASAKRIHRAVAQGDHTPETGPSAKMEEFRGPAERALDEHARRYPESPTAAAISTTRAMKALERQDTEHAAQWIELLEKHQPRDATLESLKAESRLIESIGQVWAPALKSVDGRTVDWMSLRGKVGVVVFWSPRYRPSMTVLRKVTGFVGQHPDDAGVVAIAIDDDPASAKSAVADLGYTGPLVHDGLGWRSPLAKQYGIRVLPTVLFLDREGRLAAIEKLGRRQLSTEVVLRLERMTSVSTTAPAESQPTEHDDGVPLPTSND